MSPLCRKQKSIQNFWASANEKADLQIQPGNFGLVPEADSRNVKVSGYLRPGTDTRISLTSVSPCLTPQRSLAKLTGRGPSPRSTCQPHHEVHLHPPYLLGKLPAKPRPACVHSCLFLEFHGHVQFRQRSRRILRLPE